MSTQRPQWTLRNSNPLPKAKTKQLSVTPGGRCNLAISFYVRPGRLNTPQSLTVLPSWKLRANLRKKLVQRYDLTYFTHLITSCLGTIPGVKLERPTVTLQYQRPRSQARRTVTGKIIAIHSLSNDDPHYDRYQGIYLTLVVRLKKGCQLPTNLRKINLQVIGHLLPRDTFQYGVCDKVRSRFRACSDQEYLTNPGRGTIPWVSPGGGSNMCQIFYLRDHQSPDTYCKFDVTTA